MIVAISELKLLTNYNIIFIGISSIDDPCETTLRDEIVPATPRPTVAYKPASLMIDYN